MSFLNIPPVPAVATAGLTRPTSVAPRVTAASGVSAASGGAIKKVVLPVTAPLKAESSKEPEHGRMREQADLIKTAPMSTNERVARKIEPIQPDLKPSQPEVTRTAASGSAIKKIVLPVTAPQRAEPVKESEQERVSERGDMIKTAPMSTNERVVNASTTQPGSAAPGSAIKKVVLPVTTTKKAESPKETEHVSEQGDLCNPTPLFTNERAATKLEATHPDFKPSQTKVPRTQQGCNLKDWQRFVEQNRNLTAEKSKKAQSPGTLNMAPETRIGMVSSDSTKNQKPENDSLNDQIKFKAAHLAALQQAENDRVNSFNDYWTKSMSNIVEEKSNQIDSAKTQRGAAVPQQASGAQRKPDNYIPSEVFNSSRFNQIETSKPKSHQLEFFSNGANQTCIPFKSPERLATDERKNGRNPSRPRSETEKPVKSGSESKAKPVNPKGQYPERAKTFFIEDGAVHLYPFTFKDFVRQQVLKPGLIEGTLFSVNIDRTFGLIKLTKESKRTR